MDIPTYQQLLAEVYDEQPTNLLVHQEEYDDVSPEDNHPDELDNQEEFQVFQGSRQLVEVPKHIPKYVDNTKQSVTYDRDVQTRVINIDSRFRLNPTSTIATRESIAKIPNSATNFLYKLTTPIKNVVSVRLSSVEIPNTFYTFSTANSNIQFRLYYPSGQTSSYYDVAISEGNYIVDTTANILPNNLTFELENKLNANTLGLTFDVIFNQITSKLTIVETSSQAFDMDFITNNTLVHRISDWGIGYNLGFKKKAYVGQSSYTGEGVVNAIGPNYLLLKLDPDWNVVTHRNYESTQITSFAKIVIAEAKNMVIYDNGANTITKEYWFDKPQTIRSFHVELTDLYSQPIDLLGEDMSLTIELKEVMNTSLYQHYLHQQQPTD